MHVILANYVYMPWQKIKHAWYLATEKTSFHVDISAVEFEIHNVAGYCSKYITKAIFKDKYRRKEKHYCFSRHKQFKRVPYTKHGEWNFTPRDFEVDDWIPPES